MMEHEPMVKRRRCGMSLFPTTPPGTSSQQFRSEYSQNGSFSPVPTRPHSLCGSPMSLNRGVKRAKRKLDIDEYSIPSTTPPPSPFLSATPSLETG